MSYDMGTNKDIDEVITAVLAGQVDCFAEIIRCYQSQVVMVVASMLFERQEVEELVQRTFIKAFERLDQYKPAHDLLYWLKEIARNEVRQYLRAEYRQKKHLENYAAQRERLLTAANNIFEDDVAALRQCTETLNKKTQELFELRYQKDFSIDDLCEVTGRSRAAIEKAMTRARAYLHDCIGHKRSLI